MEIIGIHLSEDLLGVLIPIAVYWSYSGILELSEPLLQNYRLHPKKDEGEKNLVSKWEVAKSVLLLNAMQILLGLAISFVSESDADVPNRQDWSIISVTKQVIIALLVIDTWTFFVHYAMHHNKFLYRRFHSCHHRVFVPYSFAAMYNSFFEGFISDSVAYVLAIQMSGLSPRGFLFLQSVTMVKIINDHCGLVLPGNPFDILFENSTVYHDSHHQLNGLKYNLSGTYFVFWDKIFGTYKPAYLEKRPGGGFKATFYKDQEK